MIDIILGMLAQSRSYIFILSDSCEVTSCVLHGEANA